MLSWTDQAKLKRNIITHIRNEKKKISLEIQIPSKENKYL